jgi:GAF domain-containing protein
MTVSSTSAAPGPAALPQILAGATELARACAQAPFSLSRLCRAVDDFAQPVMRHSLCTVNRLDANTMRLTRLYSSNPDAYPAGGTKDKRGTEWGRQVLLERQAFVGEGTDAIRAAFDDHAAIARLRLQSVVNIPVVFEERCLGTLNLLMEAAIVSLAQVDFAQLAGLLLLPVFFGDRP